ncbi:twin-arginine translocation signal domain-containing protein [Halorarum halobium]|uniref:twin-arginine translocation signal domain-containing protein n=1 Tax=Halorarum halobium TaxID=3075121 RepID=UPI0028B0DDD8|nr:twin-arginine translocation signal domain-containing protein [Halobaculum sp. XH14]
MTEENPVDRLIGDESRRSFVKKSAVATAGMGAVASGAASAQEGDDGVLTEGWQALIFVSNFRPAARFTFVSDVVEWTPNYGDVRDSYFSDYDTRMIRWLNTGETVPLFVVEEAEIGEYDDEFGFVVDADDDPNQPQVFEMNREWAPFGDNEQLITVDVSPVAEDEEDAILDTDDWWEEDGTAGGDGTGNGTGNGTATGTPGGTDTPGGN